MGSGAFVAASSTQRVLVAVEMPLPAEEPAAADVTSGRVYLYGSNGRPVSTAAGQVVGTPDASPLLLGNGGLMYSWADVPVLTNYSVAGRVVPTFVTPFLWANAGAAEMPLDHLMVDGVDGTYLVFDVDYSAADGRRWHATFTGQIDATIDYSGTGAVGPIFGADYPVIMEALDPDSLGSGSVAAFLAAQVGDGTGDMLRANNLSDVVDAPTALANLGGATSAAVDAAQTDAAQALADAAAAQAVADLALPAASDGYATAKDVSTRSRIGAYRPGTAFVLDGATRLITYHLEFESGPTLTAVWVNGHIYRSNTSAPNSGVLIDFNVHGYWPTLDSLTFLDYSFGHTASMPSNFRAYARGNGNTVIAFDSLNRYPVFEILGANGAGGAAIVFVGCTPLETWESDLT